MKEKIYLIPGLMTDERLWKRIKVVLEDRYELIHMAIPHSENFDEINDEIIKTVGNEKINILGFSLGGYIASYFTVKFPSKVKRLFLVGVTPSATDKQEEQKRKQKLDLMEKEGFKPLSVLKVQNLIEKKNKNDLELIQTIQNMYIDMGKDTFISQLNSTFNRIDLFDELNELDLPIWLFLSLDDRLLNKDSLNKILTTKHNFKLFTRQGTSHNLPLEEPHELSRLITQWMN